MKDERIKFSFSMYRKDLDILDAYAAANDLSRSRVIREAIRDFLSRVINRTINTDESDKAAD